MNFKDSSLDKSQIEYMWEHDFIDDRLWGIYRESCRKDFESPRCKYFQYELDLDQQQLNPYSTNVIIQMSMKFVNMLGQLKQQG